MKNIEGVARLCFEVAHDQDADVDHAPKVAVVAERRHPVQSIAQRCHADRSRLSRGRRTHASASISTRNSAPTL